MGKQPSERTPLNNRLSMDGLELEEALRGAMEVEPPSKDDDDSDPDPEPENGQDND